MTVGIPAYEGLKYRRGHLKHKCDDSYLYECQSEVVFEYRVDRRNYRLHRIIEKMGDAYGKKY